MSKFIKYNSTLTNVTSFSANFETRELSARPEFTADNTYTTLTNGFSGSRTFTGYGFDSVEGILLSATNDALVFTNAASGKFVNWPVSGFTSISSLCDGATLDPPLSGLLFSDFALNNYNSMTVNFPELTATGTIDVIALNAAGYGSLVKDIHTTITIN